jgi:hypothetical protein
MQTLNGPPGKGLVTSDTLVRGWLKKRRMGTASRVGLGVGRTKKAVD